MIAGTLCVHKIHGDLGVYNGEDFIANFGTQKWLSIPTDQLVEIKGLPKTIEEDLKRRFLVSIVNVNLNP